MWIERLRIERLRLFEEVELGFRRGLNVLVGANGAGKTSVLEAVHVLANGRSFRGNVRDGLIRSGSAALRIYAELDPDDGSTVRRIGVERGTRDWSARIDGSPVPLLSDVYRELAVVCFEPGSHALIAGTSEHRRRFLDWALFHVEHAFLADWRGYQRALRQRNALLKQPAVDVALLDAWEADMAQAGERLTVHRRDYLARFEPVLLDVARRFLPEAGQLELRFQQGWGDRPLADALQNARNRDMAIGHTTVGPHRADWEIRYERLPSRETFSRGQEKLTVLACVLAQAELFAADRGSWPVVLLDDLASELDAGHLALTLDRLVHSAAQVLVTGTAALPIVSGAEDRATVFHVEHARVRRED
ncbi:DNA replication/repair protein RecF [Chiayiivirga flava]|uniref:DNA replication and repair protein RecF n=1 Tax=Chiayiivirga flava TaxID=659595 RepID=A0A7W8D6N6_9GAMM|nr:DNA replication/repair protein RecF [Chiayiivirga flava]MBB5207691.1 DNA replication and repair protein RecF [Chiayiivirga flava]